MDHDRGEGGEKDGGDNEQEGDKERETEKRNVERDRSLDAARRLIHKQGHPGMVSGEEGVTTRYPRG